MSDLRPHLVVTCPVHNVIDDESFTYHMLAGRVVAAGAVADICNAYIITSKLLSTPIRALAVLKYWFPLKCTSLKYWFPLKCISLKYWFPLNCISLKYWSAW
jgi:hypothetical protein